MTSENNQDVMATPEWMMVGQVPAYVGEVRTVTRLDRVKVSEPEKTSDASWRKGCEAAIDAFMEATRDRALENITERQLDEKRDALDAALKKAGVEYVARIEIKNKLSDEALGLKAKTPKKIEFLKASQPVTEMDADQPEPQKVAAVKAPEPENPSIAKMRLVTLPLHNRMDVLMGRLTDFWGVNNRELYVFNRYFKKNYANANEEQRADLATTFRTLLRKSGLSDDVIEAVVNYRVGAALGITIKGPTPQKSLWVEWPWVKHEAEVAAPEPALAPDNTSLDKMRSITLPADGKMDVLMHQLANHWSGNNRELFLVHWHFKKNYANANEEQRADLTTTFRTLMKQAGLSDDVIEAVVNYRVGAVLAKKSKDNTPKKTQPVVLDWAGPVWQTSALEPAPTITDTAPVVEEPKAKDIPQAVADEVPPQMPQPEKAQGGDLEGFRRHMRQRYTCANSTEKGVLSNALRAVMDEEGVPAKTREAAIRDLLGLQAKRGERNDWQERAARDASSAKVR